ncbi:MAG TPA: prepilin peptidase [Terriglobia bacterium]|nr:prepilin peptidase [Terriglobia bacterium]
MARVADSGRGGPLCFPEGVPYTSLTMVLLFTVLIGLAIGSFLNVCISRIPLEQSVVSPRSRCPQCKKPIGSFDNIPVLSYIILGGRCRNCKKKISIRYPLIEALTATVSALIYLKFDIGFEWAVYFLFCAALIALAFIDADHRILPDVITLNGLWIGIAISFFLWLPGPLIARLLQGVGVTAPGPRLVSIVSSVIGAAIGGGLLWGVREAYFRVRGVEGMGFGDVKMMAMVGAFVGTALTLFTILVGSVLGSVIGIVVMRFAGKDRDYELPFGTFLSLGAILAVLYGNELIRLYLNLVNIN